MNWNSHSRFEGKHAFLGASKYHWINYTEEKLKDTYLRYQMVEQGTKLHAHAANCINFGTRLTKTKKTLNMYVNDCIDMKMRPEQILMYSDNCFGTADAISFRGNTLRIFDLKTGLVPAHMEQLMVYAALFCLEYHIRPGDIKIELRIYQNNDILVEHPTADHILPIMDKIKSFDKLIDELKGEEDL